MKPFFGEVKAKELIRKEKKDGKRYAEVTIGDTHLIHSYFFQTKYIALKDISQAFMRVAGGEFGEFPLDEYSLVLIDREGTEHVLHVERGEYIKGILETLKEKCPHVILGKYKGKQNDKTGETY